MDGISRTSEGGRRSAAAGWLPVAVAMAAPGVFAAPQARSTAPYDAPVRISLDWNNAQATSFSDTCAVSEHGRYVAFLSGAPLAQSDTNGLVDLYLCDLATGALPELITVSLTGGAGNQDSASLFQVSDDGRFVCFVTGASNLAVNDNNGNFDAFVRDRTLGLTELLSVSAAGVQGDAFPCISMSADGRYVAFGSTSSILVPGDVNGRPDIFLRDRLAGTIELVSVNSSGAQGNGSSGSLDEMDITPDGRFVSFVSWSSNFDAGDNNNTADVYVRDRVLGLTRLVSLGVANQVGGDLSWGGRLSADGRFVAFNSFSWDLVPNDTNGAIDVFVRDTLLGTTERVSVSSAGVEANGKSFPAQISADGRFVCFPSMGSNLVPGDTNGTWDVFLRDLWQGTTTRLSVDAQGIEGNGPSFGPAISRDARLLAFGSQATNLVAGDTNGFADTFVRRWPTPIVYCTAKTNSLGCVGAIAAGGVPSLSTGHGFLVRATGVLNQKFGLLLYSLGGPLAAPFHGGTLCIRSPFRRGPAQHSGGSPLGLDCTGTFAFDFAAWAALGADPMLVSGRRVWSQYWSRDPGFSAPDNVNLTDAVNFDLEP